MANTANSIAEELQTNIGINISTKTVKREFHGQAAACKPHIQYNAKRRLEWCKARCHWTLEQWKHILWSDKSHLFLFFGSLMGLDLADT